MVARCGGGKAAGEELAREECRGSALVNDNDCRSEHCCRGRPQLNCEVRLTSKMIKSSQPVVNVLRVETLHKSVTKPIHLEMENQDSTCCQRVLAPLGYLIDGTFLYNCWTRTGQRMQSPARVGSSLSLNWQDALALFY